MIDQGEILEAANETGLTPYVINLYRRPEAQAARDDIRAVLAEKCAFKKINVPKLGDLLPFRDDVSATWVQMLNHQLPQLLSFETFWDELPSCPTSSVG